MIIILFNSLTSSGESSSEVLDEIFDNLVANGYSNSILTGAVSIVDFNEHVNKTYNYVVGRLCISTALSSSYGSFEYKEYKDGNVEIVFDSDSVVSSDGQYSTAYILSPGIGDLYLGMSNSVDTADDVNEVKRYSSDVIGVSFARSGYTSISLGLYTDSSLTQFAKLPGKFITVFTVRKNSVLV